MAEQAWLGHRPFFPACRASTLNVVPQDLQVSRNRIVRLSVAEIPKMGWQHRRREARPTSAAVAPEIQVGLNRSRATGQIQVGLSYSIGARKAKILGLPGLF